jgi:hypothetical protein
MKNVSANGTQVTVVDIDVMNERLSYTGHLFAGTRFNA